VSEAGPSGACSAERKAVHVPLLGVHATAIFACDRRRLAPLRQAGGPRERCSSRGGKRLDRKRDPDSCGRQDGELHHQCGRDSASVMARLHDRARMPVPENVTLKSRRISS